MAATVNNSNLCLDLYLLGIITSGGKEYTLTDLGRQLEKDVDKYVNVLAQKAHTFDNIKFIADYLRSRSDTVTHKEILKSFPNLFGSNLKESSKSAYASISLGWAKFVIENH